MKQQTSKELLNQIHAYIESLPYSHDPKGLYDPIEYVLGLGGETPSSGTYVACL